MVDFLEVNCKVSEALRQENSEVVYKAWLFLNENAQFENNNVVISVPNIYTKEIFEERYLSDIESLYRSHLNFNKIIFRVVSEDQIILSTSIENSKAKITILDDIIEKVNSHVKQVYEFIENAAKNGYYSVSCALAHEPISKEEIYWNVKDFLVNRGFKVELNNLGDDYVLNLSW